MGEIIVKIAIIGGWILGVIVILASMLRGFRDSVDKVYGYSGWLGTINDFFCKVFDDLIADETNGDSVGLIIGLIGGGIADLRTGLAPVRFTVLVVYKSTHLLKFVPLTEPNVTD